ncbi:type II toxin-antitoxin system HipA family toxin [Kalamiella sp. sgz302252]|uniref:type II toxin-antitoxin system HipA family toxin n=1 Tax=Pantoea sp. sgz302252 TaxID=3341827 RepID=UPI0036D21762
MNPERCLISSTLLKETEAATGYCRKGLRELFGKVLAVPLLSFTRSEFIQKQPERQKGMSISGYQPKLSLQLESGELNVVNNNGGYILKPSPEAYPSFAENEHATMMVMKRLRFSVPPFGLIRFKQSDELAFIIKRYDRQNEKRLHQEQLDGAMGIDDKYGHIAGKRSVSYERACCFLNDHVNNGLKHKRDLFLRIVYAYVLGNNDFHLRNFGILHPESGRPYLAPVYDFISVAPYPAAFNEYLALPLLALEENDRDSAPGIDSPYGEYTGVDFVQLAEGMDINPRLARKWLTDVIGNHQLVINTYRESHMPAAQREQVLKHVARRMTLLAVETLV